MNKQPQTKVRVKALDALRGIAILMMILSAMVPFSGVLPGWMYHAQCPPPTHAFNPDCLGITWVDLVFPFFIFSMGAAIPFALSARQRAGKTIIELMGLTLKRFGLLAFFAIGTHYMRPWVLKVDYPWKWWIALGGFLLFFLAFAQLPHKIGHRVNKIVNNLTLLIVAGVIYVFNQLGWVNFSFNQFDIIIMVLACLALFGQLIYLIPGNAQRNYMGIALMVGSFFLSAKMQSGWTLALWNDISLPPFISWEYLKYLLILLPGMIAGDIMKTHLGNQTSEVSHNVSHLGVLRWIPLFCVGIVINCLVSLYLRYVELGFVIALLLSGALLWMTRRCSNTVPLLWKLLLWGVALVLVGFLLEPLQGGIKKDAATISYLVLTPGLAFLTLAALFVWIDLLGRHIGSKYLLGVGQNPMVAYLAGTNFVFALFMLTGINSAFFESDLPVIGGLFKAIVATFLTGYAAFLCSKNKIFWKS